MPLPIIGAVLGTAGRAVAGTAARAVAGQAAKTAAQQTAKTAGQQAAKRATHGVGRTAPGRTGSGKTLQAIKPRKQWDYADMASNFTPDGGE